MKSDEHTPTKLDKHTLTQNLMNSYTKSNEHTPTRNQMNTYTYTQNLMNTQNLNVRVRVAMEKKGNRQ